MPSHNPLPIGELDTSLRLLMGPGPSDVPPRVLRALAQPPVGHLDPEFLKIMDEVRQMLQAVFKTKNEMTLAISGTGSAGMEACFVNLVEPGDEVVVGVNGVFGARMADVAGAARANVVRVESPWGRPILLDQIAAALKGRAAKAGGRWCTPKTPTGRAPPRGNKIRGTWPQRGRGPLFPWVEPG